MSFSETHSGRRSVRQSQHGLTIARQICIANSYVLCSAALVYITIFCSDFTFSERRSRFRQLRTVVKSTQYSCDDSIQFRVQSQSNVRCALRVRNSKTLFALPSTACTIQQEVQNITNCCIFPRSVANLKLIDLLQFLSGVEGGVEGGVASLFQVPGNPHPPFFLTTEIFDFRVLRHRF